MGDCGYYDKNRVEMKVLLDFLNNNHLILKEFSYMCNYRMKWLNHDFGNYSEIVLIYNDKMLDNWDENNPEKFNMFREWFNEI